MTYKDAAEVAFIHIVDNVVSLQRALPWEKAFDSIRISFTDLARAVNIKLDGANYNAESINMPLGLIKLAINMANKEDSSIHIPQVTFVVVKKGEMYAPLGALYKHGLATDSKDPLMAKAVESEQPLILKNIYDFSWTPLVKVQLLRLIRNGPPKLNPDMIDASIPHWWPD